MLSIFVFLSQSSNTFMRIELISQSFLESNLELDRIKAHK